MTILSQSLIDLLHSNETVSSELALHPEQSVHEVAERLYGKRKLEKLVSKLSLKKTGTVKLYEGEFTTEDLDLAAKLGKFPSRPSDLFLKMYLEALRTLDEDPLAGLVSPPLMGSSGVIPLSIISVIPDIIQHYADVIVRARKEVFFATNFWEASDSATTICEAMKELSRRAGERGEKVVFKMMYDRGTPKQVLDPHQFVDAKDYTAERVKLPAPEEIPNIDMQVVNYHEPPVGTFHAKYLCVDRKIALLNSNNIQDRVNVEMMTHIEGDVVESLYDMALLSWSKNMEPPLPLLLKPEPAQTEFKFGQEHAHIQSKDIEQSKETSRSLLNAHHQYADEDQKNSRKERTFDVDNQAEADRIQANLDSSDAALTDHLNTGTRIQANAPRDDKDPFHPHVLHAKHDPFPIALVNRRPRGKPGHGDTNCPQDAAFLAAFKYAQKKVFIQTPTFNAPLVVDAALDAVRRGIEVIIFADLGFNDEGELLPMQGGTNEMVAVRMYKALEKDSEKALLRWHWYTGKDQRTPLNASEKSRNCHVKLLICDDHVGIQGNGNQDVQSWYHSQEINQMIDSESVCKEWAAAIRSNQNTHLHGELAKDGIWRDEKGEPLPGATGGPKGPFKSLAGVKGAIQRVRGEGGF